MIHTYKKALSLLALCGFLFTACAKAQPGKPSNVIKPALKINKNLTDDQLLDLVQKQTFRYFWDFAHPVSGLARERSNASFGYGNEVTTTGGTGFGIMATIVATDRKWITRDSASRFLLKMVNFLSNRQNHSIQQEG
jgi:hypothetical protein